MASEYPEPEAGKRGPAAHPDAETLAASFEAAAPLTLGLEEEVYLVDRESLDLAPLALEVLGRLGGDPRFKPELPAAQVEILTAPAANVGAAVTALARARGALAAACEQDGRVLPLAAAVHPFAAAEGALNSSPRYQHTVAEYGFMARRQLVGALQVHVAVGGAERTLAVYNALRGWLPVLAALAASAPFYEGRDTGLASVRPKISEQLPRQGIPPCFESWEQLARAFAWGAEAGVLTDPGNWWWELRPHPAFGTLEVRVPDTQTTLEEAGAVTAVTHCLVAWLSARHDGGERLPCPSTWQIAENRWLACRDGVEGSLIALDTGARAPTREILHALLDQLEPTAGALHCAAELVQARELVRCNGAMRQRRAAAPDGPVGLTRWLAARFCPSDAG
ncbi:MAG: YbdK family carboxylate-amine ligase [Solirubrobacterales bacterium]|nr:YbdK family carboxylate-amine ligase [Solirubrobacterales bacterium]